MRTKTKEITYEEEAFKGLVRIARLFIKAMTGKGSNGIQCRESPFIDAPKGMDEDGNFCQELTYMAFSIFYLIRVTVIKADLSFAIYVTPFVFSPPQDDDDYFETLVGTEGYNFRDSVNSARSVVMTNLNMIDSEVRSRRTLRRMVKRGAIGGHPYVIRKGWIYGSLQKQLDHIECSLMSIFTNSVWTPAAALRIFPPTLVGLDGRIIYIPGPF